MQGFEITPRAFLYDTSVRLSAQGNKESDWQLVRFLNGGNSLRKGVDTGTLAMLAGEGTQTRRLLRSCSDQQLRQVV
jgi:hypothetical protein